MDKKNKKVSSNKTNNVVPRYKILGFMVFGILVFSLCAYLLLNVDFGTYNKGYVINGGNANKDYGNTQNEAPETELVKAVDLINDHDNEAAIKIINEEIAKEPTVDLYYNQGVAFINTFKYDDCITSFTKVIEMTPENPYAYLNRAYCLSSLSKNEEALEDLDKGLKIAPTDPLLLEKRANVAKLLE